MSTLIICRGVPASGKTTWAVKWASEGERRARVCRDDVRHLLYDKYWGLSRDQENAVTVTQHGTIAQLLRSGWDVVVDDTNLRAKTVRDLAAVARRAGAIVEIKDFEVSLEEAVRRDREREFTGGRAVGSEVIRSFWDRYITKHGTLPPVPDLEENDEATVLYVPDGTLPRAWMVDLDGTLAKMTGRGPFEWHRVGEDEPNMPVLHAVTALRDSGYAIIVASGRDECCRDLTENWLDDHRVPYEELWMRPEGDTRKDSIVKAEMFWQHIAPAWNVWGVLDDRDQVVAMWRSIGLACFQVAPGDF